MEVTQSILWELAVVVHAVHVQTVQVEHLTGQEHAAARGLAS